MNKILKNKKAKLKRDIIKYAALQEEIERLEETKAKLNASIKKAMSECNLSILKTIHHGDLHKANYYGFTKAYFGTERFKEDYPDLYDSYCNYRSNTYLRIERIKNEIH